MKIKLQEIPIFEVAAAYKDNDDDGVIGYNGKLNIRPSFQREFVYDPPQRNAVIHTVTKDFPLNVFYWAKNQDNEFEMLDGQQRTISICQYINGDFSIILPDDPETPKYFYTLTDDEKNQFLNYRLMVYICEGSDKEKLDWFKVINIAGAKLTDQELRNAIYTGPWLSDAKKWFSKTEGPADDVGGKYIKGIPKRQDYLELALKWISDRDGIGIEDYMAKHQYDSSSNDIWLYFQTVINWVKVTFPHYRKVMKDGIPWGILYNKHHKTTYNPNVLEAQIAKLMLDEEVDNKRGIYPYVLNLNEYDRRMNEKLLSLRKFSENVKIESYERQEHKCAKCGKICNFNEMQGDHITPWSKGGKTNAINCQMLCAQCNRMKSDI